jgi:hypothetical protein
MHPPKRMISGFETIPGQLLLGLGVLVAAARFLQLQPALSGNELYAHEEMDTSPGNFGRIVLCGHNWRIKCVGWIRLTQIGDMLRVRSFE